MAIDPYNFKDQHSQEWQQKQREIAGRYTAGTSFDPPPPASSCNDDYSVFNVPSNSYGKGNVPLSPSLGSSSYSGPSSLDGLGTMLASGVGFLLLSPLILPFISLVERHGEKIKIVFSVAGLIFGISLISHPLSDQVATYLATQFTLSAVTIEVILASTLGIVGAAIGSKMLDAIEGLMRPVFMAGAFLLTIATYIGVVYGGYYVYLTYLEGSSVSILDNFVGMIDGAWIYLVSLF